MSRVPWSRYSGEEVESVVAILLLRKFSDGRRIRPASGDGGVDVLIPATDGTYEVFQVKRFTGPLTSSHKAQIAKSLRSLRNWAAESGVKVSKWHVVRPEDPTHNDESWLMELTDEDPFDSYWKGLSHIDGWAAEFPEVVDYYLRDSGESVNARAASLFRSFSDQEVVGPALVERVGHIHSALNASDPHYRYELSTHAGPVPAEIAEQRPGLVMSRSVDDGRMTVTIDVYARYAQAVEDRPLSIDVALRPSTSDEVESLRRFVEFGQGFSGVSATVSFEHELLGMSAVEAQVSLSTAGFAAEVSSLSMRGLDGGGVCVIDLPLRVEEFTVGQSGDGFRIACTDLSGFLAIDVVATPSSRTGEITLESKDPTGRSAREVASTIESLRRLPQASTIEFLTEGGDVVLKFASRLQGPREEDIAVAYRIARALSALEKGSVRRLSSPLLMPDMSSLTHGELWAWEMSGALLRGLSVQDSWTGRGVTFPGEVPKPPFDARFRTALSVPVGSRVISLGDVIVDMRVEVVEHESNERYVLRPGGRERGLWWLRAVPAGGADLEPGRVYVRRLDA